VAEPPITADTIAAAERIAGVEYTEAERALMLDNIGAQIALAHERRAVALPPTLPPATRFDPRPPGFVMPPQCTSRWPEAEVPDLPEDEADIAYAPLTDLAGWIRTRRISAVRLARIYLDRIARIAPTLACVATLTPERAIAQAERADRLLAAGVHLGPLHGIPWGCKDIIDTAGIVTAWGAEPFRDRVPEADATVVARLSAQGAVMLGKLSVGALGYGDLWYGGRTRNPWNTEEGSSGSSAGPAAATAAGLVGFSLGTETLGSIVAPCLRCGATGLRPTFGRLSRTGVMPLCWTLDKVGPICRTVADTALVLQALNGLDPQDVCQIPAPFGYDATAPLGPLRVGYYDADFAAEGAIELDRAALAAVRGLGLELVPLRRSDLPYGALTSILDAEAAASFEELTLSDRDDMLAWQGPRAWPNAFRKARFLSAVDHVQLDRLRRRVMQDMDAAFHEVDAIIGPALAGPMLVITNFTGHPCLVLPCGFHPSPTRPSPSAPPPAGHDPGGAGGAATHSVPHAICLWGRLFDEATILRLGVALEAVFGLRGCRPPVG
jgi:Asp-tRNA(Asn)/Glu-tRNA(Gln) amidotransferase A subunit family amidase